VRTVLFDGPEGKDDDRSRVTGPRPRLGRRQLGKPDETRAGGGYDPTPPPAPGGAVGGFGIQTHV